MCLTESSGRAAILLASDTIILIRLVALPATVRALTSIDDTQLLLAIRASIIEVQEEVLDSKLAKDPAQLEKLRAHHLSFNIARLTISEMFSYNPEGYFVVRWNLELLFKSMVNTSKAATCSHNIFSVRGTCEVCRDLYLKGSASL